MKNINAAWQTVMYWKLSAFRCLLYAAIVMWGVFKAGTQGYDHMSDMSSLQKIWLYGDMFVAGGGVVLAFLDTSITKLGGTPPATSTVIAQASVSTAVDPPKP